MSEQNAFPYTTNLNILFPALSLIDIPSVVSQVEAEWFNQTLCQVNDSVIRLGVLQGEYHWHKHDNDDEFFFVLEGRFIIDLEDQSRTATAAGLCRPQGRRPPHARTGTRHHPDG